MFSTAIRKIEHHTGDLNGGSNSGIIDLIERALRNDWNCIFAVTARNPLTSEYTASVVRYDPDDMNHDEVKELVFYERPVPGATREETLKNLLYKVEADLWEAQQRTREREAGEGDHELYEDATDEDKMKEDTTVEDRATRTNSAKRRKLEEATGSKSGDRAKR
ncbi:uncharacterized protein BDZ99DRAFT_531192 [Mytilinidion resinicola]|uniref:Uncharacterized protein n=1 Tax=Mytilinidion resinicola TaxID=574789 RepID=A0A6A6ZAY4_9PEZI|nr:uncharacterized protein BDZ99DRAFT_531192 [Mytilinidion resinicola]KAF2818008.1 hypothetical protein BDZ99DRAFT_531192 [Mytilinidion resinicola]